MPIYEYQARHETASCAHCAKPFECLQRISDPPIEKCPKCGASVVKIISAPAVGSSKSGFDQRAKAAGFTKLQRLGKGEYEKKY
jgi:putative FmdB family regulatory protein